MHKKLVCRLCLAETQIYSSLLEEESNMLEALTSIKIGSMDELNVVCIKCRLNLKLAYNIQQNMIKANENLSQQIEQVTVKKEVLSNNSCTKDLMQICGKNNQCIICGLFPNSMNTHIEMHFNEQQFCDLCSDYFVDFYSYKKHLKNHLEEELYHCTKCEIFFRYKSFYNTHLEKFHKKKFWLISGAPKPKISRTFSCDLCSKVSNTKGGHINHVLNHKKKACPICKKVLAAGSLKQHVDSHSDSPQICEKCGSTLKNTSCLRMHMRYSHNKQRFSCKECGKDFKKKLSYNHHMTTVHGEPKYMCDTCGKKFFSINRLNIHKKMTHLKLRPYVCQFCKKGFSSKFALTTHRRQHTNETPYRCEVCGEGFRQNVSLKGHRKSKHNIEEPKICKCEVCGKGFASEWALKTHNRLH